jgi:hypothetical protein
MKPITLLVGALALAPLASASPAPTDGGLSKRCPPEKTDGGCHRSHAHHPTRTTTANPYHSSDDASHQHHHQHNYTPTSTTRYWGKPWKPKWSPVDETTTGKVASMTTTSSTSSYGKLQTTSSEEEVSYLLTRMTPSTTLSSTHSTIPSSTLSTTAAPTGPYWRRGNSRYTNTCGAGYSVPCVYTITSAGACGAPPTLVPCVWTATYTQPDWILETNATPIPTRFATSWYEQGRPLPW